MKRILLSSCLLMGLASVLSAAGKEPEVKLVDGKMTIMAEDVTLKQFLQLFDTATGMSSRVSPLLANEKITVRLEGLEVNAAIRKSFQGRPWNYVVAVGKGINVIDRAQLGPATTTTTTTAAPITTFNNDVRNDTPPPSPNNAPFSNAGPVPVPAAAPSAQPAALNLPPAQGGPAAPPPLFQPVGQSLGAPLPGTQPAK